MESDAKLDPVKLFYDFFACILAANTTPMIFKTSETTHVTVP